MYRIGLFNFNILIISNPKTFFSTGNILFKSEQKNIIEITDSIQRTVKENVVKQRLSLDRNFS
jgi:uncharacterized protein (DUF1697 family)